MPRLPNISPSWELQTCSLAQFKKQHNNIAPKKGDIPQTSRPLGVFQTAGGKNAQLICNNCVEEKRQDKLTQAAQEITTSKEFQETQMKTLENKMIDLTKTVTEIKTSCLPQKNLIQIIHFNLT